MFGINLVVLLITIVIGLCLVRLKFWVYDGCFDDDYSDTFKILLSLMDTVKDSVFIYTLLMFLLYGIK